VNAESSHLKLEQSIQKIRTQGLKNGQYLQPVSDIKKPDEEAANGGGLNGYSQARA